MKSMIVTRITVFVLSAVSVFAQQRYDMIVRQDFFSGFAGNKEALARGMKTTEETLAKDPNHAEAKVWHGAGLLVMASQAFQKGEAQNGMKMWQQALTEMEQAVRLAPNNVRCRDSSRRDIDYCVTTNAARDGKTHSGNGSCGF